MVEWGEGMRGEGRWEGAGGLGWVGWVGLGVVVAVLLVRGCGGAGVWARGKGGEGEEDAVRRPHLAPQIGPSSSSHRAHAPALFGPQPRFDLVPASSRPPPLCPRLIPAQPRPRPSLVPASSRPYPGFVPALSQLRPGTHPGLVPAELAPLHVGGDGLIPPHPRRSAAARRRRRPRRRRSWRPWPRWPARRGRVRGGWTRAGAGSGALPWQLTAVGWTRGRWVG